MLHGAAQAIAGARLVRQRLQGLEIELHAGDRPVGHDDAAVARAGLHRDLAESGVGTETLEGAFIAVHERPELVDVAVLPPDLPDLAPDRNRDPLRLAVPDVLRQLGRPLVVHALLLVERGLGEIDEGGGIDVDVVEAGMQLFVDQGPHRRELRFRVGGVFLGVGLNVVSLHEQRSDEAFAHGCRGHHGDVFRGALARVADLAARDFYDDGPDVEAARRTVHRARGVVRQHPDVDGGGREDRNLGPALRQIELVDRRRTHAGALPDLPDQPAGFLALLG